MIKRLSHTFPAFILFIACIVFSWNFTQRYDLPLHDEALYAEGWILGNGWSPLYGLLYKCLNFVTSSRVLSFSIWLFTLTFLILPFTIYSMCRKLDLGTVSSSVIGFICLLAPWNFPSEPKLQLFNFCFLGLALLVRWSDIKNEIIKSGIFYSLLVTSLYFRADNLIVLGCFFLYDLLLSIQDRNYFFPLKILGVLSIPVSLFWMWFGSPSHPVRNYHAFLDHFYWRNVHHLKGVVDFSSRPVLEVLYEFFDHSKSIAEAYSAQPAYVLIHFKNNLFQFHETFFNNFSLLLNAPLILVFAFFVLVILFQGKKNLITNVSHNFPDFLVFSIAIFVKCFIVSILLQPQPKYSFEMNAVILVGIAFALEKMRRKINGPNLYLFLGLPCLLFFHPFEQRQFSLEFNQRDAVKFVNDWMKENKMRVIIANKGPATWISGPTFINLHVERKYDEAIRSRMKEFLDNQQVDGVILEPDYRRLLSGHALGKAWNEFEFNPGAYGFQLVNKSPDGNLMIYARK